MEHINKMTTLKTILPVIPPPMPAMSMPRPAALRRTVLGDPVHLPREPTKPRKLPTKVWSDTRGYHRKVKIEDNK
jgi:hypothetical protein